MSDKKDMVTVGVRVLALYIIFQALISMPGQVAWLYSMRQSADPIGKSALSAGLIGIGVTLFFGLGLWNYSKAISSIVCKDTEDNSNININSIDLQAIMVSVLGLYVLSLAIPSLVNLIVSNIFPKSNPKYNYELATGGKVVAVIPYADYASTSIKILFGLWCTLKAEGIVNLIRTLWDKGKGIND